MIGLKAPVNASTIRRLQHNHPTRETQQDQEDNQVGNKEELYQRQVQQQEAQFTKDEEASKFQRRMEAHVVGVRMWITEVPPTLYAEPPRFSPLFRNFYNQQEDHMSAQVLRAHFTSVEGIENYFRNQDQE